MTDEEFKKEELELLRLIYKYSTEKQVISGEYPKISENFIRDFYDIVLSHDSNPFYLQGIKIDEKDKDSERKNVMGKYTGRNIYIYTEHTLPILNDYFLHEKHLSETEKPFYMCMLVSKLLFHELEHSFQERKIYDSDNNNESLLIILDEIAKLGGRGLYDGTYDISVRERLADINAYKRILELVSYLEEYLPNLVKLQSGMSLKAMLNGYTKENGNVKCPTIEFLRRNNLVPMLKDLTSWYTEDEKEVRENLKDTHSLYERIKLGLPINEKEYNHTLSLKQRYNKYI